jgi:hypothetical protein
MNMISFFNISEPVVNLDAFHTAVEDLLAQTVGHMPHSEILKRCQRVSNVYVPFVDKYYLDEKLLFETEIKFLNNTFMWEIRKPKEAQEC